MAADRYFEFNTVAECKAFLRGVEFVNDSRVEVIGAFAVPGKKPRLIIDTKLYVWLLDGDAAFKASDYKPKRWFKRQKVSLED